VNAPIQISPSAARRFVRRALLLDAPAADVGAALAHHGYVQIDPINVCGRMHDLILRNRVADYREGDLMRHVHGAEGRALAAEQRTAFEHHLPSTGVLVAFPLEAWPHLLAAMHARTKRAGPWSGRLTPKERELAPRLFAEIAARGPLCSEDFADAGGTRRHFGGWGSATLAKSALQKLFFHGRLLIARRDGQRRIYDLPERVLPAATLALPEPPAADTARWLAILKLRQRRLVLLKREEFRAVADLVQPVAVAGCPLLHCLRDDVALLAAASAAPAAGESFAATRLLAPLDPLIYDRRVTAALWGFDYTWEVYTPPHKRVRGYYALPILAGEELVGHVDPKADRAERRLKVMSRQVRRGHKVAPAVRTLAAFLQLRHR
jgi:uncharacterized protein YcaQ